MKFVLPLVAIALGLAVARAHDNVAWKPEAADLLFSSSRDGNSEVYVLRAGQKEWVNLSNDKSADNWPVWSPDGKRVVFQSNRAGNLDIFTMTADGTEQVQLTRDFEPDYLPSWSPDGTTILFTSWRKEKSEEPRAPHVYAMSADGSNQRRLVRESLNTSDGATWSADGRTIVYSRKGDKGADVYIADSDGTNERRITNDQAGNLYNGSATISPDGKSIAFYADNEKSAALMVIGIDGKNRRTIVAEGYNWYPRWSPDSRWITYTAIAPGDDPKNIDLFAVPVEGDAAPILLVGGPKREVEGSWRPTDTPQGPYDAALAKSLGADERGMRKYVLVVLKSGPTKVPTGEKRTEMFKGHMANIRRLASEGKLALAGPLDGVDGWRGLFVFATPDIATARAYVATDPVIIHGEMVAEYHEFYGSAGLMMMNEISHKISKESP